MPKVPFAISPLLLLFFSLVATSAASAQSLLTSYGLGRGNDLQGCVMTQLSQISQTSTYRQVSQTPTLKRGLSDTATCMADRIMASADGLITGALNRAYNQLNKKGKARFGQGFHIDSSFTYSLLGQNDFQGSLNAVIPLYSFSSSGNTTATRAVFLQNGITRWTDGQGIQRSDVRIGIVHRFVVDQAKGNLFGLSALLQQNLELGHERLVTSIDYTGIWGKGSITYFKPKTGWRPGRSGYLERPIEGLELDTQLKPTTTIVLNVAFGRWQDKKSPNNWLTQGRLGVEWLPHSYLSLGAAWNGIGTQDNNPEIRATIRLPLGGKPRARQHWQGLGLKEARVSSMRPEEIWRPVTHADRIEYVERKTTINATNKQLAASAQIRFLQASVVSGKTVTFEVSLPDAVPADVLLVIAFSPGDGNHPAMAGVDYVDELTEVWIRQGESKATMTVKLPRNADLSTDRTLKVTVASATLQGSQT